MTHTPQVEWTTAQLDRLKAPREKPKRCDSCGKTGQKIRFETGYYEKATSTTHRWYAWVCWSCRKVHARAVGYRTSPPPDDLPLFEALGEHIAKLGCEQT